MAYYLSHTKLKLENSKEKMKYNSETADKFPLKILLAEDDIINQKLALHFLERIGYTPDVAFNGIEVLSALKLQKYDLILMDIQMPQLDGEQTTLEIRQTLPQKMQPRIIAVTANTLKTDIDRYLTNGFDGCLIKPFNIEEFVETLKESYCACKSAEKELNTVLDLY
ncbi:MAG: response regulator [Ignavibacteriales bacterium]|nr:MAG: response regulator [Ignavibacteriales bacterium]